MKKKTIIPIIFLVIFLFSILSVSAEKITTTISDRGEGITIVYPKDLFIKENTSTILNFDVVDSNYSKLTNATTNCSIDAVNLTGENIIHSNLTYDATNKYWYYQLSEENTDIIGTYSFYVYCVNNDEAGYFSSSFVVTSTGLNNDTMPTAIALGFLLLIPLIIAALFFFVYHALADTHYPLKVFLMILGFVFVLIEYNIVYEVAYFFNYKLIYTMMQHWAFSWCFYVIITYIGIALLYNLFMRLKGGITHTREKSFEELR